MREGLARPKSWAALFLAFAAGTVIWRFGVSHRGPVSEHPWPEALLFGLGAALLFTILMLVRERRSRPKNP